MAAVSEESNHKQYISSSFSNISFGSRQTAQKLWLENTFMKRECCKFVASSRDANKCSCGRVEGWHVGLKGDDAFGKPKQKWHHLKNTSCFCTDAYGTIEFQGAPHPNKAQYIRLSSVDSQSESVLQLMTKYWGLELPKLLITVHGGLLNFDLQPKLKRLFRKGLLKAAKTTGAWIFTNGTNTGVTKHVGDAISERTTRTKSKVVAVGVAPWGMIERTDLIGHDVVVPYHCLSSTKVNYSVLNKNHSYFLLADNGTVGKYGGEVIFRRKLEKYIGLQKISINNDFTGHGIPVIGVVLEGGVNTIRAVLEYVTDDPPVPVVICDGSGRAADLLSFAHRCTSSDEDDGEVPEGVHEQLVLSIRHMFNYSCEEAERLFLEIMLCVKRKDLITIFQVHEDSQDMDLAILTALVKGTSSSASDQLNLVLAWDRVDIARSHIFVYGQEFPDGCRQQVMMDALVSDRVDFVKLLLENGVSMNDFLNIERLELLYNTNQGPTNTLKYVIRDVRTNMFADHRYTLLDIGLIIQHLMGGAFRSAYCRRHFRQKYLLHKQKKTLGTYTSDLSAVADPNTTCRCHFEYPFHDLMIWAVLMKRQRMALFMWQHGEEAMAKALLACTLYRSLAHEADQDDLDIELSQEFRSYSLEFQELALELLEHCHKADDEFTQQLLTYEIKTCSEQTNLGLAVTANHRKFIAHTACQVLLNDLWIGGLRMRKNTSLNTQEELRLMPQTIEEHMEELQEEGGIEFSCRSSLSSRDGSQADEEYHEMINGLELKSPSTAVGEPTKTAVMTQNMIRRPDVEGEGDAFMTELHGKHANSELRVGKKIYEFYNAPITIFWLHTLAYLFFVCIYIYVVLSKLTVTPRWQELYVMAYIATLFIEKMRQLFAQEPVRLSMKIKMFLSRVWNIWDLLAIAIFAFGAGFRFCSRVKDAHLLYAVDVVLWNMRILELMSVNQYLGPYVKIIAKLIRDMAYYLVILFIVVTSFGVVRQAIVFQDDDSVTWSRTLRNVWFYPYWMIYGELFADEIDPCEGNEFDCNVYGSWLSPALMCIYLLIANILGVNLLIAKFNATFIKYNAYSREIWMFQRYQMIIEYEMRPILPPPLIIITHLYLMLKCICNLCKGKRDYFENSLKLFLSRDDAEKLHDFEEQCVEDLYRDKESRFQSSTDERVRLLTERVESMCLRTEDTSVTEDGVLHLAIQAIDYRLGRLEEIALKTNECLELFQHHLSMAQNRLVSDRMPFAAHGRHFDPSVVKDRASPVEGEKSVASFLPMCNSHALCCCLKHEHPIMVHGNHFRHFPYHSTRNMDMFRPGASPENASVVADTGSHLDNHNNVQQSHGLDGHQSGIRPCVLDLNNVPAISRSYNDNCFSLSPTSSALSPTPAQAGEDNSKGDWVQSSQSSPPISSRSFSDIHGSARLERYGDHRVQCGASCASSKGQSPPLQSLQYSSPADVCTTDKAPVGKLFHIPCYREHLVARDISALSCNCKSTAINNPSQVDITSVAYTLVKKQLIRSESTSSKVKEEELMAAEELERHKMEARIRRRLRKISQDDKSGSINNIARLFVSEMDVHLMSPPIDDSDEDADKDPQGFDLE